MKSHFFLFFTTPPPHSVALSFQNKEREEYNFIPCGNVMQSESREGITAAVYDMKKSLTDCFVCQCWRKTLMPDISISCLSTMQGIVGMQCVKSS